MCVFFLGCGCVEGESAHTAKNRNPLTRVANSFRERNTLSRGIFFLVVYCGGSVCLAIGVVVVVRAGIGMTPCASVLTAMLKYRWRFGQPPEKLHFYWVVQHNEVDAFQWCVVAHGCKSWTMNTHSVCGHYIDTEIASVKKKSAVFSRVTLHVLPVFHVFHVLTLNMRNLM